MNENNQFLDEDDELDMEHKSIKLANEFQLSLTHVELRIIKSLLDVTRRFFKHADLFVVDNQMGGKPVLRCGVEDQKTGKNRLKNKVVLSVGSPKNGKRPMVTWGGQGTRKSKVEKSEIYQLDGIEDVFGTMKGIALDKIDSKAIDRYRSFLKAHKHSKLIIERFSGSCITRLTFDDEALDTEGHNHGGSSRRSVLRKISGDDVVAWLDEQSLIQEPLIAYLKNHKYLRECIIDDQCPSNVGPMDIVIKSFSKESTLAILELKSIRVDNEKSANQTRVRHAYGQLLDYSVNQQDNFPLERIERWLVVNHIPKKSIKLLTELAKVDSRFSVWTYNEQDDVPLVLRIGKSDSFAFLSNGTKQ
ncbi:hypothetical protein MZ018_14380 [Shewanella sp. JNE10-2]|uniref:hypothetical protein n=1 Tax=unclassified Shewanella TaxID=196818 RepID=UPI002004BAAD|nr:MULTISPECIES: hypothetical protein [unclassified Shewanella]MCK7628768.1 hypothetical protein [Shewanella sp. JNE9-1]MCK7644017.1 hypothetical protein [Shewanella sp. JNE3-1]MCK7652071.1 hypothetical protein [Shewanella sp. JNE4-1]UPO26097.1 hypothetical protein MZ018_14380 [Shewanella sp. JNE10-2]UPO37083.1 hypothetical protein MZ097_09320 [Shewanella sp. JNE7]